MELALFVYCWEEGKVIICVKLFTKVSFIFFTVIV